MGLAASWPLPPVAVSSALLPPFQLLRWECGFVSADRECTHVAV